MKPPKNEKIVLAQGPDKTVLTNISSIPVLQSSSKAHALENILAAVGAAWALNIPKDIIVAGLQTYN
jgi:cyanophycin synthetase